MLYLKGPTSWITIYMEAVRGVRLEGEDDGAWANKELEGAPERNEEEIERKRRYSQESYLEFFTVEAPASWPEVDEEEF